MKIQSQEGLINLTDWNIKLKSIKLANFYECASTHHYVGPNEEEKKRTTKLVRITNYPQTLKRMKKVLLHFDISLLKAYLSHFPFDTEQKSSMAVWGPKFDI